MPIELSRPEQKSPIETMADAVYRRFGTFISGCVLTLLAAIIYLLLATPLYQSTAVVSHANPDRMGRLDTLAGAFGSLPLLGASTSGTDAGASNLAVMRSRQLAADFIRSYDLFSDLDIDDDTSEEARIYKAVSRFHEKMLVITPQPQDRVIHVSIIHPEPDRAAYLVDMFIAHTNNLLAQRAQSDSARNIDFLKELLAQEPIVEIQRALSALLETEIKTLMLASGRHEFAFKVLDAAMAPNQPIHPRTIIILLLAIAGGIIFGIMLVLISLMIYPSARR